MNNKSDHLDDASVYHEIIVRDISQRVAAQEALSESEERLRTVIEQLSDGISITDEQGVVIVWNSRLAEMTGLPAEAMLGKPIWDAQFDLLPPVDRTPARRAQLERDLRKFLATGQAPWAGKPLERALIRPDGSTIFVEGITFLIRTRQGYMLGSVTRDITERIQAEQLLKENQARLLEAERIGQMGNWSYEVATGKIEWSLGLYRIFGRDPDEVVTYDKLLSWIHPDDREPHDAYFARMLAMRTGDELENLEYRLIRPDGEVRWVDVRLETTFDEHGLPAKYFGTVLDITERKRAERERDEARQLFQKVFALSPVPTTLSSVSERRIVDVNTATEKWLGYSREELIGRNSPEIDYWADPEERQHVFETLLAEGHIADYEFSFKTKSGATGRALVFADTFEQQDEQYVLATFVDVTERVRTATELLRYREHLEDLVAERTAELQQRNEDLRRFALLAADRELRMKELRDEIKALRAQLHASGQKES